MRSTCTDDRGPCEKRRRRRISRKDQLTQELETISRDLFEVEFGYLKATEEERKERREKKKKLDKRRLEIIQHLDEEKLKEVLTRYAQNIPEEENTKEDIEATDYKLGIEIWLNENLQKLATSEITENDMRFELPTQDITQARFSGFLLRNLDKYQQRSNERRIQHTQRINCLRESLVYLAKRRLQNREERVGAEYIAIKREMSDLFQEKIAILETMKRICVLTKSRRL